MMDYASRQRSSNKLLIGLGAVLVFHVLLLWAINSGLARKFVKVIKGPVAVSYTHLTLPTILRV